MPTATKTSTTSRTTIGTAIPRMSPMLLGSGSVALSSGSAAQQSNKSNWLCHTREGLKIILQEVQQSKSMREMALTSVYGFRTSKIQSLRYFLKKYKYGYMMCQQTTNTTNINLLRIETRMIAALL